MQVNRGIFKAYDIRGLVEQDLSLEFATGLGKAFATFLGRELQKTDMAVVVGRDMRPSSLPLQTALIDGLTSLGVHVVDIGLVSTPAFYFGVADTGADGGIMVSASHNPAQYNGFKMVRARAVPIGGDTGITAMADIMEREDFAAAAMGSVKTLDGAPAACVAMETAFANVPSLPKLQIVADSANGMGAQFLDLMFAAQPNVDVTRMFWEFDGTFPNHEADPFKAENIAPLCAKVKELGADVGIATDGDGDRIFFVDNMGEVVEPAIVRGLIARALLRRYPGAKICYDIRPGKITEDMIRDAGGVPVVTRVGHALIKATMIAEGAIYAGESSGHFYVRFPNGSYEGPVATALILLDELVQSGKTFAEFVAPFKKYAHSGEINFTVADKGAMLAQLKEKYADAVIVELDGVSFTYPTFWFNVRASNTESLLRLNLEAVDNATMMAKRDEIAALLAAG